MCGTRQTAGDGLANVNCLYHLPYPTMTQIHPLSQLQHDTQADVLQRRLASLEQHSDTQLDDLTQAQEVEAAVADIDNREFSAVTQALLRIHRADYGLCVDCHLSIGFERLQLEPQALRCTSCQTLHERAH